MLKHQCDECERPATHHAVEIEDGVKTETHLCDLHASEQGLSIKNTHLPITELLNNFVQKHSGGDQKIRGAEDLTCEECGMTFTEFRENSLLGCPDCYVAFEGPLSPLLERAHEGGTHHAGKVPRRAGVGEQRQVALRQLRRRLDVAVQSEDYEQAAQLRDEITSLG
ncbi:MAG: UvrB/UvrC motif-containing protein [Algisphaera sp.]